MHIYIYIYVYVYEGAPGPRVAGRVARWRADTQASPPREAALYIYMFMFIYLYSYRSICVYTYMYVCIDEGLPAARGVVRGARWRADIPASPPRGAARTTSPRFRRRGRPPHRGLTRYIYI